MAVPLGSDAIIHIGVTSSPTTPVGSLNQWENPRSRPETTRAYYMEPKQTFVGESEDTLQLQGDYNQGDAGQAIIRTAYKNGTTVFVKVLPDGTNGFTQEFRVSQSPTRGPSPDDPPGCTFNFVAVDAPVDVGSGL